MNDIKELVALSAFDDMTRLESAKIKAKEIKLKSAAVLAQAEMISSMAKASKIVDALVDEIDKDTYKKMLKELIGDYDTHCNNSGGNVTGNSGGSNTAANPVSK